MSVHTEGESVSQNGGLRDLVRGGPPLARVSVSSALGNYSAPLVCFFSHADHWSHHCELEQTTRAAMT